MIIFQTLLKYNLHDKKSKLIHILEVRDLNCFKNNSEIIEENIIFKINFDGPNSYYTMLCGNLSVKKVISLKFVIFSYSYETKIINK